MKYVIAIMMCAILAGAGEQYDNAIFYTPGIIGVIMFSFIGFVSCFVL